MSILRAVSPSITGMIRRRLEEEEKTLYHALIKDRNLNDSILDASENKPSLVPSSIRLASAVTYWFPCGKVQGY